MRPSGIGLHLNSLTSAMGIRQREQAAQAAAAAAGESSKGVLATVLGLQPPKEDTLGGYPAIPLQSFNPGSVASLLERRNDGVEFPTTDFRSLNVENLAPLEETLSLTPLANLPRLVSPRGQKRSQQELIPQGDDDPMDDLMDSPRSKRRR